MAKEQIAFNLTGMNAHIDPREGKEILTIEVNAFESRGPLLHEDVMHDMIQQLGISERDIENAADDFMNQLQVTALARLLQKRKTYAY